MDIAVQVQKLHITDERFVFTPCGILEGSYNKEKGIFIDKYGCQYSIIDGTDIYGDCYFCYPTTMEALRETFFEEEDDNAVLHEFISNIRELLFIGYFDNTTGRINVMEFNFSNINEHLIEDLNEIEEKDIEELQEVPENKPIIEFDVSEERFVFDLKALKQIQKYQTIDEVKAYIDRIIAAGEYIKNVSEEEIEKEEQEEKKYLLQKEESKKFSLAKLRSAVLENIVGQDKAVYDLTRAIAINQTSKDFRNKSHILITGPAGTGKTEMVNIVAKELNLPIFKASATAYTKSGYKGKEVQSMLTGLLDAANGDIELAENGILIIDEIDKTVSCAGEEGFGKAVLYELLKILDRDVFEVDIDPTRNEKIMFNTSNLTVILMGSFESLYQQKKKNKKNAIGFNSETKEEDTKVRLDEDDLIKWMGPEFVGRIGYVTSTESLNHKSVLNILKNSKLSQLKIAQLDLEQRGVTLTYTSSYLNEIAKNGYSEALGARKLNNAVKESLVYVYDEVLINPKVKSIKLTKQTAINNKEYCVEY